MDENEEISSASQKIVSESAKPAWICQKCGETIASQFSECWRCAAPAELQEVDSMSPDIKDSALKATGFGLTVTNWIARIFLGGDAFVGPRGRILLSSACGEDKGKTIDSRCRQGFEKRGI